MDRLTSAVLVEVATGVAESKGTLDVWHGEIDPNGARGALCIELLKPFAKGLKDSTPAKRSPGRRMANSIHRVQDGFILQPPPHFPLDFVGLLVDFYRM